MLDLSHSYRSFSTVVEKSASPATVFEYKCIMVWNNVKRSIVIIMRTVCVSCSHYH